MDKRLQKIVDEAQDEFGLDAYRLERTSIYKQRDSMGEAFYLFNMEWFPKEVQEPLEEDTNPDGAASIEYNIQEKRFESVVFVQGQSFSTKIQFAKKTPEEVAAWVEQQTGLTYGSDFKLSQVNEGEVQFKSDVDGIPLSPNIIVEVKFDEEGKLTFYSTYGSTPIRKEIEQSDFTLTLEEIEPLVKQQLQLVKLPSEIERRFIPAYAMEEVYVTMDGTRIIPFLEQERLEVQMDFTLEWDKSLEVEIIREEIRFTSEASVEDAFGNVGIERLTLIEEQIERTKAVVRDVMGAEFPNESGKWKLAKLRRQEKFIEAHCEMIEENPTIFNRKVVMFIHPEKMSVLNFMDNDAMFEIFDSFAPAEKAIVTHEEAFEKMVPYITLDPTYVYDELTGKYILCGLLDAAEAVDAVTGEIISLSEL